MCTRICSEGRSPLRSDYDSRLDLGVSESLLDLTSKTALELAGLKPRDRIDVQSFIWVVGDYQDSEQPAP